MRLSRRQFLATTAFAGVGSVPSLLLPHRAAWASTDAATVLRVERLVIDVLGRAANTFGSGTLVLITNIVDGTVSEIDAASRSVVETYHVGRGPNGITFRPSKIGEPS